MHVCSPTDSPASPPSLALSRVARRIVEGGKPAFTEFTVLASEPAAPLAAQGSAAPFSDAALAAAVQGGGLSLVACRPLTGRTHQVRGEHCYCGGMRSEAKSRALGSPG